MEIYTETPEQYEKGDSVVVKWGDNNIIVGLVRHKNNHILQTSIPEDAVISESDIIATEQNNWKKRFEDSQYQVYMKAEVNNSGNISIEGL